MRHTTPLIITYSAIGMLVVGALLVFFKEKPRSSTAQQEPQVATSTISEETATYKIDAEYPQFGVPAIDAQIKKDVEAAIGELKTQEPLPPDSATLKNSFTGRFDRVYIGPDVISVELVLSTYTGGAHDLTLFSGVNFDRATGKRLEQKDAFAIIGKTVQEVSAGASAQLAHKLGNDFMFPEGASTNPENFSSFLISKDAVTFIFQEYQVAAYAYGPQEVRFSRVR